MGTFSAAWKAADRFVRKHEGEKMSKFSPTILSAPTLVCGVYGRHEACFAEGKGRGRWGGGAISVDSCTSD